MYFFKDFSIWYHFFHLKSCETFNKQNQDMLLSLKEVARNACRKGLNPLFVIYVLYMHHTLYVMITCQLDLEINWAFEIGDETT